MSVGLLLFPTKNTRYVFTVLLLALLIFTKGCGVEGDAVTVNFAKTIAAEEEEQKKA